LIFQPLQPVERALAGVARQRPLEIIVVRHP
jgi:hypothetical protein